MAFVQNFSETEPKREEIDALEGPTVVEFGTPWCGFCRAAQPLISSAFEEHSGVRHIKVEDGKGRRLGRSFGVKLWPTLVFLKNGEEVTRVVRPETSGQVEQKLTQID